MEAQAIVHFIPSVMDPTHVPAVMLLGTEVSAVHRRGHEIIDPIHFPSDYITVYHHAMSCTREREENNIKQTSIQANSENK